MVVAENSSKYCYDNGVLINKLGIKDSELLHTTERNFTTFKIVALECGEEKIDNLCSVDGYLALHKYICSEIYPFAGQIRDEGISKSNAPYFNNVTPFCYPEFIYPYLKDCLDKMNRYVKRIKSREELLKFLSYYYGELNMIHPFREVNGRTLRIFMKLFVESVNEYLPFDDVEINYSLWRNNNSEIYKENLLKATIICNVTCDCSYIEKCFDEVLVYKEKEKNKRK